MSKNILEKIIEKKKEKINYLKKNFDVNFLHDLIKRNCSDQLKSIREFNSSAINMGITCPVLSSNLAYYDQMFSNHIIGETIQLQRSFFGLHPISNFNNTSWCY